MREGNSTKMPEVTRSFCRRMLLRSARRSAAAEEVNGTMAPSPMRSTVLVADVSGWKGHAARCAASAAAAVRALLKPPLSRRRASGWRSWYAHTKVAYHHCTDRNTRSTSSFRPAYGHASRIGCVETFFSLTMLVDHQHIFLARPSNFFLIY